MAASVIGNGKRGWTLGVSCCWVFFFSPLLAPKTMPLRTNGTLCGNKRNIIKADEVIGSKQNEDSIVIRCTLTDSQQASDVCLCQLNLITVILVFDIPAPLKGDLTE